MWQWIKSSRRVIEFIYSHWDYVFIRAFYYGFIIKVITVVHLGLIFGNLLCIVFLIMYQPIYVWLPLLSLIASPLMGGSNCYINRLENIYRIKAGMPLIEDRLTEFLTRRKK